MANFNSDQAEVLELDTVDMHKVDGGNPIIAGAAAVLTIIYCADYISQQLEIGWNCYK